MTKQQAALNRILKRGGKFRSELATPFNAKQKIWFCSNVEIVGFNECPKGFQEPFGNDFYLDVDRLVVKRGKRVLFPTAEQLRSELKVRGIRRGENCVIKNDNVAFNVWLFLDMLEALSKSVAYHDGNPRHPIYFESVEGVGQCYPIVLGPEFNGQIILMEEK